MKVIALRGKSDTGKSDTLKRLIRILPKGKAISFGLLQPTTKVDKGRNVSDIEYCIENAVSFEGDIYAIFNFDGIYLGISSQGDDTKLLQEAYDTICTELEKATQKTTLDIFVCAVRSFGGTNDLVKRICDEPPVVVYDKASVATIETSDILSLVDIQKELNYIQAQILFNHLKNFVDV